MRRLLCGLAIAGAASATHGATPLYVSPDVATDPTPGFPTLLPWQVTRYAAGPPSYTGLVTIPGSPMIDGLHKLDKPGAWLFSVESASDLGGVLSTPADVGDIVRFDPPSTYAKFFCGDSVSGAIPEGSNVDALLLSGGDTGELWISFDVPTTIGAATFDPADLVAYRRTGTGCTGWTIAPGNPVFDASAAGTGIPSSSNVIGAEKIGSLILLTLDVPTDLGPPGSTTYTAGQVLAWSGTSWSVWESLSGWPQGSGVDGLAWVGNPGRVGTLTVNKSGANLVISWAAGCSDGGTDYGIYQGTIGSWYSHVAIGGCTDVGADRTETITPGAGNRYYLVTPHNAAAEGSYGPRSNGVERPVGGGACVATQIVTPCP
jgi:hypothetical protein